MYGTGREKLFKDQGFYSQDLHVCSLEINEYFNVLTASFECLHQIYIYVDAAKCKMGIQHYIALNYTSVIEVHPPFHTKRLMCKDHIRGSFPTCLKELIPGRGRGLLPYLVHHFFSLTRYFCMSKCI